MNKIFLATLLAISLAVSVVFASMPLRISMLKVVMQSDHVLTAVVTGVDMIDENGDQITDLKARTGPGLKNKIRLISEVQKVHRTNSNNAPSEIRVPLDSAMHYSLGHIKDAHQGRSLPRIFILKGDEFEPSFDGIFSYPTHELETIMALYKIKDMEKDK